ncbi:MAG: hypothetical protein GF308_20665 [Candidatus Heimdallarchaeota archaeon]|nr:hypothetical protein [Candidatus Heimdallarchaeota archaeon]
MENVKQITENQTRERNTEQAQKDTPPSFRKKLANIWAIIKPTIFNTVITFIAFIIALFVVQKLLLPSLIALITYGFLVFIIQPLFGEKIQKIITALFGNSREIVRLIRTKNDSLLLQEVDNSLVAISLLQVTSLAYPVKLRYLWDFLKEEGIFIQDCLEGCFLIIKKKAKKRGRKNLQELSLQLVKEVHKTIIRTVKRFELEYQTIDLQLVRGEERILTIINLGLTPEKFSLVQEMPKEDIDYLRDSHLVDKEWIEDPEEGGFYDVSKLPPSML